MVHIFRKPGKIISVVLVLICLISCGGEANQTFAAADTPDWMTLSEGLVAHAGGGIDGRDGSNSLEAIEENYEKGHRVFEIDLNLTTDGDLVCVHDWPSYSGPLSKDDFLKRRIFDAYTAISLSDLYELMLEHEDMYIVTDTKSFEYSDGDTRAQFTRLYTLAEEIDAGLLDRIIPQIYNRRHYEILEEIYSYKSVIYTLYASPDSDEEVVAFVTDKPNISVITMGPVRYSKDFYKELTKAGKSIYFFTLNDIDEVFDAIALDVNGFYTDFITPGQMTEERAKRN